jgi:hypothetical protein
MGDCSHDEVGGRGMCLAASSMRDQDAVPLLAFVERHKLFARDIFHLEQPLGPRKRATHGFIPFWTSCEKHVRRAKTAAPFVGLLEIGATATVWYFHTSWISNPENPSNPLSRNATV